MKKKLFTLMTLLLCLCSTAWAEDITISPTLSANQTKFSYGLYTITHSSTASSNGSKISSSAITTGTNGDVITINFKTTKSDMYIKSVTFNSLSNGTLSSTDGSISNNVFSVTGNKNDVKVVLTSSSNSVKGSVKVTNVVVNTGNNSVETITFSSVSSGTISFTSKINNVSVTSAISSITTNGNASVSSNELSWASSKTLVFTSSKNINYIALLDKNDKVYANSGFSASPATYADAAWNGTSKTVTFTNNTGGGRYILKAYVVTEVDAPHTVSFNAGEHGTYTGGDITEESAGAGITLPNLTTLETGYTFNGWYTASTDGTKVGNAGDAYAPSSDTELFAQYSAKTYSITLNANGGTDNGSATATYNSNTLTSITAPTNASYSVQGYYQEAACTHLIADASGTLQTETDYTDASGNWTHDGNVTLYAKWLTENDATFSNGNYVIGGSALDLSTLFTSSSDGAVTYTVKDVNGTGAEIAGTSFTATTAGTATVTATQAATATYAGATLDATITVGVNPLGEHTVTYNVATGTSQTTLATASKLASSSRISNLTDISLSNLSVQSGGGKTNSSPKIDTPEAEDASKYTYFTFKVENGYQYTISKISTKLVAVSTAKTVKCEISDNNGGTTQSLSYSQSTNSDPGAVHDFEFTSNNTYSGTVTVKLYVYGDDKTYRLGKPLEVTGNIAVKTKTALTGAWDPTSVSVAKDASAPSNPTFAMSAGTAGSEGDYTISYSEVSDENNIVTTNASTGITGISTANAGTATIRATVALTETGAASYTLATTTYDITVTVSNIATLFSMTDITGPTTSIAAGKKADVTATFSDGGSAEICNAHASNSSVMVTSNTIYLTSSGNSYCHVLFPTKLQAGDVIALGETTGTAYISKTTSKGSTTYTIPYTIPAESGFIGATDIYIFNNKDQGDTKVASFNTLTIQGVAAASDLTITSDKNITLATNATSNITYTSSNTTGAVTYATSASSVAEVSSTGVITAKAPGTATITITQASDGIIREAAAKVIVTVERARKATEVTGEFVLDTNNGTQSSGSYITTDESVYLEGGIDNGSNTYNDLKNSHFKHSSDISFTLPTNYPVSTVWFVGYNNGSGSATIKLKKVDGADVTEQSGTVGGNAAIPAADCVGFALGTAAEESMVINISNQCRGYFILNPAAQNITLTQVGTNYYASYYSVGETTITGATAYTATLDAENSKVVLTECANGVVGGRTGVILIGSSASATATPSFTGAAKAQGDLIGVGQKAVAMANYYAGSTSAADKVFVLGVENEKAGLYKYTGTNLGVNKAYLYNETLANSARVLSFTFDNETTAINGVSVETVKKELKKYFENGQIVIEKDGMKFNAAGQQIK